MIMVALKSMALSAICGALLSAVTVGAASAGSSSTANPVMAGEFKKYDPNCIKDCNDVVDPCMAKAGHKPAAKWVCARHYSNCTGKCKSQIE
ncbi:MAG: hypothetical protein ACREDM_10550 [Methylocella sp.]